MLVAEIQLMVTSTIWAVLKAACANIFDTRHITIKLFIVEDETKGNNQFMERTLVLIKPDAIQRDLVGELIHTFERKGLKLVGLNMRMYSIRLSIPHAKNSTVFSPVVGAITRAPLQHSLIDEHIASQCLIQVSAPVMYSCALSHACAATCRPTTYRLQSGIVPSHNNRFHLSLLYLYGCSTKLPLPSLL